MITLATKNTKGGVNIEKKGRIIIKNKAFRADINHTEISFSSNNNLNLRLRDTITVTIPHIPNSNFNMEIISTEYKQEMFREKSYDEYYYIAKLKKEDD
ncbi:hypothetical protein SDC9_07435 [bioreactor metagenome]|uniref:Uncharacterized protein n=1 Tax=bioreactor metagenome TaxID=1076179 RepID=A0A644T4J5_9ZZZZ|nr:hypothetical protein [Methanobrevibacter sp.]MEA4956892.1 hypothetical protein [Methanobrevibacter sp.]